MLGRPFLAPIEAARGYSLHKLRRDVVAGLTVSVVEVPQAIVYAAIAGVPPQYGLYTSIIQGILGAMFSSGEHLTTGPTNTQSLLIASAVTRLMKDQAGVNAQDFYLQMVFGLTLLKGLIQLAFAAAQMGNMVRYVSRSVIVGVSAGAGVLIVAGQLPYFLGLKVPQDAPWRLPGVLGAIDRMWPYLHQINWRAVALGGVALGLTISLRAISRFFPSALTAVVACAAVVWVTGWKPEAPPVSPLADGAQERMDDRGWRIENAAVHPQSSILHPPSSAGEGTGAGSQGRVRTPALPGGTGGTVPTIAPLPPRAQAIPWPGVPQIGWSEAEMLLGGALALALLGMLESVSIAKTIASQSGEQIQPNQEFLAQGLTNFVSSFFQCIPGSGSFTRSALDYAAGAQTRFAAVFNALFVATIFYALAPLAQYIPLSALAAVLFVIAWGLIEWRYVPRAMQSSRSDAIVCIITFLATLLAPLEFAIFIGIFLNIGLYVRTASRLHIAEMVEMPGGRFIETPLHDRFGQKQVMFLQVEGDLFFGVADELQDRLAQLAHSDVRVVIFRLKRTHSIDSTVLNVLEQFATNMKSHGRHVILCGLRVEMMHVLRTYGLVDVLGKDNVFASADGVFASAKKALLRARELCGRSIDMTLIDAELEEDELSYEI